MDIGYATEKVTLFDTQGNARTIAGQNGKTQLIISAPFLNKGFKEELHHLGELLSSENDLELYLVMANQTHEDPHISGLNFLIDNEGEFGDWYGVRLVGDVLGGEFTKSLMLISKDGAIFYDEYPKEISQNFDADTLQRKILAAQSCYTGKGCH